VKQCAICDCEMQQRDKEAACHFAARQTCSSSCRAKLSNRSRPSRTSAPEPDPKQCAICFEMFSRRSTKAGSASEESRHEFSTRRVCSVKCMALLNRRLAAGKDRLKRTVDGIFGDKQYTIREIAAVHEISVPCAQHVVLKLLLQRKISPVGRKNKNEVVYGASQVGIQFMPILIPGYGKREHNCQRAETMECLDNFDKAYPNYDGSAHCPPGCQWFEPIPAGYWRAKASEGHTVSQIAQAQFFAPGDDI
jgi:hypothetical protein